MRKVRRLRSKPARPRLLVATVVAVMAGALLGLAGAGAKSSSGGGQIQACVAKGGAVRFISAHGKCAKGERSELINQAGVAGPKGKNGKTGKIGKTGATGPAGPTGVAGPTGPTGPANTEVVSGPVATLAGSEPSGSIAVSTAGCNDAVSGANREAYGGGVIITPHPSTSTADVVPIQSSYPGAGVTGGTQAPPVAAGSGAISWTGVAVIQRMLNGDSATVQAYVICGP
jgi:hypothetical protein